MHRDAAQHLRTPLTVAVTGASGLVGSALCALLTTGGHRVIRLVRRAARDPDERQWDPQRPSPELFTGVDAVVHLAGASIAGRFNAAHKADIRDSRIEPTRRLAEAAARAHRDGGGPAVFVCASAIGFYGSDRGDEMLDEDSGPARVSRRCGIGLGGCNRAGRRRGPAGGACPYRNRAGRARRDPAIAAPLFAAGLGGRLGSGKQWLSWISIDDLTDIYYRALYDPRLSGPVNAVGPEPVRNGEYTAALAATLHRPALLPVPSIGPRLLLGEEGVRELAEACQRVSPARLIGLDHRFRHRRVKDALAHQLGHEEGIDFDSRAR